VLVDLLMLHGEFAWHAEIGPRIVAIRDKWARIATYLFDETGWTGRHEAVARQIDPNLTMKLIFEGRPHKKTKVRMARISFDPEYLRTEKVHAPTGRPK
jgi:hypothetical protein